MLQSCYIYFFMHTIHAPEVKSRRNRIAHHGNEVVQRLGKKATNSVFVVLRRGCSAWPEAQSAVQWWWWWWRTSICWQCGGGADTVNYSSRSLSTEVDVPHRYLGPWRTLCMGWWCHAVVTQCAITAVELDVRKVSSCTILDARKNVNEKWRLALATCRTLLGRCGGQ